MSSRVGAFDGGCGPTAPATPVMIENRPGLPAIAYRVGTFSSFREAMFQALSDEPAMAALQTRRSDDYAITLLELWACVADVLAFYQERIANEAFLRTARERESVQFLASVLGYEPRPGVSATAVLAFSAEQGRSVAVSPGLRVQSVPGQGELPQKFETLEDVALDFRLNELPILPRPEGRNPLAKGSREAYLAVGKDGLDAAGHIQAGDSIVLFDRNPDHDIEMLTVESIAVEADQLRLRWSRPVAGANWDVTTSAWKVGRSWRLFGFNHPATYPKVSNQNGFPLWSIEDLHPSGPSEGVLELEGEVTIDAGARLLVVSEGSALGPVKTLVAVKKAEQTVQKETDWGPLTGMPLTRLTVAPDDLQVGESRAARIYELVGRPIRFWGYDYPPVITSSPVYLPGTRIDAETIEVVRKFGPNASEPGVVLRVAEIEPGRRVLLADATSSIVSARIERASIVNNDVSFAATHGDPGTVTECGLGGELETVPLLVSAPLPPGGVEISAVSPQLSLRIGGGEPHTLRLERQEQLASINELAAMLVQGIRDAAAIRVGEAGYGGAEVCVMGERLVVVPENADSVVRVGPTVEDPTTIVELGLADGLARDVTGVLSAVLGDDLPQISAAAPKLSARIEPIGSREISLAPPPANLEEALEAGLRAADPAPCFGRAFVRIVGGRLLVVPGIVGSEQKAYLALHLEATSRLDLQRASGRLLGNAVLASHGETVAHEVLGDGDPTQPFQQFSLRKAPVTHLPSAQSGGVTSTLAIDVGGVGWTQVPSFHGCGEDDQVYVARVTADGTTIVRFGDGRAGARPPAGRGNILATYREGAGLCGRVRAKALTNPLDRPVGLKSVVNPEPAEGGADPETRDEVRRNAPSVVRTFGRAVSLSDFRDLALTTGDVAKASTAWVWSGGSRAIHLTVAGQEGAVFSSDALARIHASLAAVRDRNRDLLVDNYRRIPVVVRAKLEVDSARATSEVESAARAALLQELSFEGLDFGEPVRLSHVYARLHGVAGVISVDVDHLGFKQPTGMNATQFGEFLDGRGMARAPDGSIAPLQQHLAIYPARPEAGSAAPVLAAEQAWVEAPATDVLLVTSGGRPD